MMTNTWRIATMRNLLSFLMMILFLLGSTSYADVILGTSHPASSPLVMDQGTTSDTFLVDVTNTGNPDLLAGWQVSLQIVPLGATGTLTFNPGLTGKPGSNYIFDGFPNIGGPNFSNPPGLDTLVNFEATFPFATVSVPAAPGANLLKTAFDASADAVGTFGIFAVAGLGNSEWTDDTINARDYANVPSLGGNVEIGRVTVVPEPAGFGLALVAALCAVVGHPLRRRFR